MEAEKFISYEREMEKTIAAVDRGADGGDRVGRRRATAEVDGL